MIRVDKFVVGPLETNCYLVYSDTEKGGFLIDPGAFDRRILDAIEERSIHVRNIINTHGHIDHISGNRKFGYPVLIHKADKGLLANPIKNLSLFTGVHSFSSKAAGLLDDGDVIGTGELKLEVLHTPGHTAGGISLKIGKKIFTGDALFREGIGRTDLPGGNEKEFIQSVMNRLMIFDDDTEIFPGHGPDTTIGHERKHNPFLQS